MGERTEATTPPDRRATPAAARHDATASPSLLHRAAQALFRVRNFNDIHERAAELGLRLPLGSKRLDRLEAVRRSRTLFIHVPKNAGTSINALLYGRVMRHETARYYHHVAPDLFRPDIVRFAIWRDPVERFLSAYDFARRGGGRHVRIHPRFAAVYRQFRSLEDAIDHVAASRSPYGLDHVFRPQSWYLTDRRGQLLVERIFAFSRIDALPEHIPALAGSTIPHLNDTQRGTYVPTESQSRRIRALYRHDEMLRGRLTSL
ncbi:sulfotransferase family 2 domain-containing protein [Acidomonas methanolica]|uniref:Sulfotransferase n=1 Tax=Acidomonas methanolica NBRC 104435 TaxID=1231351 RepID=A0A023D8U9_ACIMT|nr:sulfotransferase family 2 domain-containing protein [Acidomonas methanolica]MBU2655693.1 sulfotransferase family 2 domain-containing protein [Acidomonas methanolica]TCS20457.1 sulfotransferase family protein [Acidomonas methanolica]GAJ30602.1 hypothetical protein Amme_203_007 [Acidomonas methanolica NBRC 104435]GBQ48923.1 hypothetical protein AA0498_0864 [Acidomonas methanolica]GEL00622.1 hypothetical protein AME01nite_31200 [Acidomonas methanolica NBRC 104435]